MVCDETQNKNISCPDSRNFGQLTPNVVTLSGSVANTDDRDKAVSIARSYAGDREVEDHLSVQRSD
jgi:osmotically-inducible protein OsmY